MSVANAVGLTFGGPQEPKAQLLNYLRGRETLLVLDNFEHLLDGAGLLTEMLAAAPGLRLLVTSRERLKLQGEWLLELGGLSYPSGEEAEGFARFDAVGLFLRTARRTDARFSLTPENRLAVFRICRTLQGMPLGLELAASWLRLYGCEGVARELERDLKALETPLRDVPERHRSLRAVFEGSWRLLTQEEQGVLMKLSVFRGGFAKEAAKEVADASPHTLLSLIDKSLVQRVAEDRFDLHEVVRQNAQKKLAESARENAVRRAHAAFFLDLAEDVEQKLKSSEQIAQLDRLERERENLRVSLQHTRRKDAEKHLRLAGALSWFWWLRGYLREGRAWLKGALSLNGAPKAARAKTLDGAGLIAWVQNDYAAARAFQEESLALRRELGDMSGVAASLNNLGIVLHDQCNFIAAQETHRQCLALRRKQGSQKGIALSLFNLGLAAHRLGEYARARSLHEESLQIMKTLDFSRGVALALAGLGSVAHDEGDHAAACKLHRESLSICLENGEKSRVAVSLEGLAGAYAAQKQPRRAARLWGAAEALREAIGAPVPPSERARYQRDVKSAREQLSDATFDTLWDEGKGMKLEQVVRDALKPHTNNQR